MKFSMPYPHSLNLFLTLTAKPLLDVFLNLKFIRHYTPLHQRKALILMASILIFIAFWE